MFILDKLLTGGIGFVLRRIASAVDAESTDDGSLKEELLAAQMRLELGEITEEEYTEIEQRVFEGMREIRARTREDDATGAFEAGNVEVERIEADVGDAPSPPKRKRRKR